MLLLTLPLPRPRRVHDGAWLGRVRQHRQRLPNNAALRFSVPCRTERRAKWEFDEQGARWFDVLGDLPAQENAHGCDTRLFQNPRNQSHGLLADRSDRKSVV